MWYLRIVVAEALTFPIEGHPDLNGLFWTAISAPFLTDVMRTQGFSQIDNGGFG